MARIMHVNHLYSMLAGGATILADSLCRRFDGDDVSVFSGDFNEGPLYSISTSEMDGIKIRSVNLTGVYGDYKGALWDGFDEKNYCNPVIGSAFREYIEEVKPDIIHFHSLQWLGANLVEEAAKFGARTVLTMHDWWWICAQQFLVSPDGRTCPLYETNNSCYCRSREEYEKRNSYLKGILRNVDRILVPSATMKRSLEMKGLGDFDIRVLENGVEKPSAFSPRPPGQSKIVFGYMGGHAYQKGYQTLRDAVLSISGGDYMVRIYSFHQREGLIADFLAGSTVKKSLPDMLEGWKFIFYPGFRHDELDRILSGIDVVIVPSLVKESFSLITREALIRGIPVIASDSGGPEEAIKDGVNGFIFKTGEPSDLASKMERFIKDRPLVLKMRDNIDPGAVRTVDEQAEELKKIYAELLGR